MPDVEQAADTAFPQPRVTEPTGSVRFRRGLMVLPVETGFIVEGGRQRQRLTGASALAVRDGLIPALDEYRTIDELVELCGSPRARIIASVRLLAEFGLLEASAPPRGAALGDHTARYLARTLDPTGEFRNADEIGEVLARACVLVLGPAREVEGVRADLLEAGVGSVRQVDGPEAVSALAAAPLGAGANWLAVASAAALGGDVGRHLARLAECGDPAPLVLRYGATVASLEIGPLFGRPGSVCPACFDDGYRRAFDASPHAACGRPAGDDLLESLVTGEVLAILAGLTWPAPAASLAVYDASSFDRTRYTLGPRPECRQCLGAEPGWHGPGGAGELFEETVAFDLDGLKAPQPDARRAEARAEAAARLGDVPAAPRIALTPVDRLPAPSGALTPAWVIAPGRQQPLTDDALASLLVRIAGFEPSSAGAARGHRWTASAGNLGSVELRFTARRAMFGRPASTLFAYDDASHQVIALHADQVAGDLARASVRLARGEPDVLLFLVANIHRLSRKYGDFSFRLAHLDAGCAVAQLAAVAAGLGLEAELAESWDARLTDTLDLLEDREMIAAVVGLYGAEVPHADDR